MKIFPLIISLAWSSSLLVAEPIDNNNTSSSTEPAAVSSQPTGYDFLVLTPLDNGKTLSVKKGASVEVIIKPDRYKVRNNCCGSEFAMLPYIISQEPTYTSLAPDVLNTPRVGYDAGALAFQFKATQAGTTTLAFSYNEIAEIPSGWYSDDCCLKKNRSATCSFTINVVE